MVTSTGVREVFGVGGQDQHTPRNPCQESFRKTLVACCLGTFTVDASLRRSRALEIVGSRGRSSIDRRPGLEDGLSSDS